MRNGLFALLTLLPASSYAVAVQPSQTLEALSAQAGAVPDGTIRGEDAAARNGKGFDNNPFHISAPAVSEYVDPATRRTQASVGEAPSAPRQTGPLPVPPRDVAGAPAGQPGGPERSPTDSYYFEGTSPVQGITIYRPRPDLTGGGRTGSSGPDNPYAKYGKWALIGGAALLVGAFVLGGPAGIAVGVLAGVALGIGGLITFLFGRKSR